MTFVCSYSTAGDSAMFISSLSVVKHIFQLRGATVYKKQCKSLWWGITNSSVPRLSVTGVRGGRVSDPTPPPSVHYTVNERRDETNQNATSMYSESEDTTVSVSIRA